MKSNVGGWLASSTPAFRFYGRPLQSFLRSSVHLARSHTTFERGRALAHPKTRVEFRSTPAQIERSLAPHLFPSIRSRPTSIKRPLRFLAVHHITITSADCRLSPYPSTSSSLISAFNSTQSRTPERLTATDRGSQPYIAASHIDRP